MQIQSPSRTKNLGLGSNNSCGYFITFFLSSFIITICTLTENYPNTICLQGRHVTMLDLYKSSNPINHLVNKINCASLTTFKTQCRNESMLNLLRKMFGARVLQCSRKWIANNLRLSLWKDAVICIIDIA